MTTTPTEPTTPAGSGDGDDQGPRVTRDEARDLGRLRRTRKESLEGRHIAGVAGGIARHLDIDPIVIRVALVVLVFFGGAGLLLYAVGWLVLPEEGSERTAVHLDPRSRTFVLYVALGLAVLAVLGDTVGHFNTPWALGFSAFVVIVVLVLRDRAWPSLHRHKDDWTPPPQEPADVTSSGAVDLTKGGTPAAPPPTYLDTPVPRSPRRRGPLLFWPTLALVALALGTLGIIDGAGVDVAGSAYFALALGIIGAALVLGAFWGRAGGLILVGLISLLGLVSSTGTEVWHVEGSHIRVTPTAAAQLAPRYDFKVGDLRVDLRQVQDLGALDGRTLKLSGDVGRIEVIVPDGLALRADGTVNGPGRIQLFNDSRGGIDTRFETTRAGPTADSPTLTINADLSVGEIRIVGNGTGFALGDQIRDRFGRN